jgi:hypothetical protein
VSDAKADSSRNEIEMVKAKQMWSEYHLADRPIHQSNLSSRYFPRRWPADCGRLTRVQHKSTPIADLSAAAGPMQP